MNRKFKIGLFTILLSISYLNGVSILGSAAYLAYTSTNTTNNFNHSSSGQAPDIDTDHYLNRDAELNFELPKDMNFTDKSNSNTFPNYNMHEDSVNWGSYLSPNTSIFESYDNSSVRTVEKEYKGRRDFQKILSNDSTSITTMNFTFADNGTIEFDTLFSDNDEFKIALCQNETEIFYIRALLGSWRFYTIDVGQSGANPSVSSDIWFRVEMRWNRLGNIYFTCRGSEETPLPFGNYSINNIKFEISDNTEFMMLNGMNSSIPKVNNFNFSNTNPLIQHTYENNVFGKDNVFLASDSDNTSFCLADSAFSESYGSGVLTFSFLFNSSKYTEFYIWNGNASESIHMAVQSGFLIWFNDTTALFDSIIVVDTWFFVELYFYYNLTAQKIYYTALVDESISYGPYASTGSLQSVSKFTLKTSQSAKDFLSYVYRDTEWFYSNETEMEYLKDFKIDTVQDYTMDEGWFPTRALTVSSVNHVNLTYDSVEDWNYDELHFETVVKIEDNSIFRLNLYNPSWESVVLIEYFESTNFLSVDTELGLINITTVDMDTNYPIWLDFSMIQRYTIVNGTYYDVAVSIASTFDLEDTTIETFSYKPTNFIGKYKFGLEFMSFGYTTAIIYAIDSNVILEYFPFTFVSGFEDLGYQDYTILDTYRLHTDCYPTFDFTRYKVQSSFNVSYSNGYVFDILDGSQTYKRKEVKSRVIQPPIIDSLAIESYQLQNNVSFDENDFTFTVVFNMSINYTVEIDMGAAKIFMNFSEGVERDGFKVWFNGTTPISLSNPNYVLSVVYLSVHKTTTHNNGLYMSAVVGSQYLSKSINITSNVSRPITNFYSFNPENTDYYSNGPMELYGMKLTEYDIDFEQYRPKLPATMSADLEFYGGVWFNPTGLLFRNDFSGSAIIMFPNPILSAPLSNNYTIDYSYIVNLTYVSTITVGNVNQYEQTFMEYRIGSNKTETNTNATSDELFQFYQFSAFFIEYSYNMFYVHSGNITINMEVYHEALWLMYIVDNQLGILELALGMIVPFILMLIFPYAFYTTFGRMGAVIGFLVGFVVFGIGALISVPAAIIMSVISMFLAIVVYKQYGGSLRNDNAIF